MTNHSPKTVLRVLALAAGYFATGWLGLMFPAFGSHITLLWLPSGIAVAALMRWGFPCWPGVALGAFAVNLITGAPWPAALGIAAGNTAGPALAAVLLQRMGVHTAFDRRRDILLLAVAAAIGMLLSASLGVTMIALAGALKGGWPAPLLIWWGGDIMGIIAAAPLLLSFTREEWLRVASRRGEFSVWICTTAFTVLMVFFVHMDVQGRWAPSFLALPLVAWAALRFGTIGTSLAIIMLSAAAAFGTATGRGPFSRNSPEEGTAVVWLYMATNAAIGWLITAMQTGRLKAVGMQYLFDRALSEVSLGVLISDLAGKVIYANDGLTRLTGYTEAEMRAQTWRVLQGPETDPAAVERMRASLREDGHFDGEILCYHKDGTTFWNGIVITPTENERDERTGFLAILRNTTKRREAESARQESESRIRKIVDNAPEAILLFDPASGRYLQANPAAERLFKRKAADLCLVAPEDLSPPVQPDGRPSSEKRVEWIARAMAGETPVFEWTHRDSEGRDIPCEVRLLRIEIRGRAVLRGSISDITKRKQSEAALMLERTRLRTVLDVLPFSIYVKDTQSRFLVANATSAQAVGAARWQDMIGKTDADYFPPAIAAGFLRDELRVLAGEPVMNLEEPSVTPDGRAFTELTTKVPLRDGEGKVIGLVGLSRDITMQKQAESALRAASQKLRLHFEQTPMAVVEWDLEFRVTEWNPAAQTIFGFTRSEALGQHASFIVPEPFRQHVDGVWTSLLKTRSGVRSTNENVRKDRRTILCEWYNTPLISEQGTVAGVASVVMDITERRRAQQMLAWEKNAMELIGSPASLHEVLDGLIYGLEKQAPGALCSILLLDDVGTHLQHGSAPSLPEEYNRAIHGATIGPAVGSCGTAAHVNRQVIVSDIATDPLWADYKDLALKHGLRACWSTPIQGSNGKVLGTFANYYREPREPTPPELELIARAVGIARIAIERKHSEAALRESEQKFRTLFENAGDAIFLMERECFTDCNARTLQMFGCDTRGQIVGHPPYEFSPPRQPDGRDSRECAIEKITAALAGQPQFFEWMHAKLDGTPFPAEVTLNTVVLGGRLMLQAVVRDISERKRAEAEIRMLNADLERRVQERTSELQAANKEMEAFSYSVSHDLRAPLRAVDGFSRIVAKKYAPQLDDDGQRMLDLIRGGAQRMGRLIDDLLTFSRLGRQTLEPAPIDMHQQAQSVFDELAGFDPGRKLHLVLHPLPPARGTQAMIRQVWVNLIGNAIKFTKERAVGEIEIGVRPDPQGGQAYYVKDNGAGFEMRHVGRLFGVFQRLHAMDEFEGTGVGLALVQRIVQRHGGRVWAEGEVDRGATFSFTLPSAQP